MVPSEKAKEFEHIPTCAMGHKVPADHEHRWSGWPGAWCMICGCEDPDELCIAGGCKCSCHSDFWEAYEKTVREANSGA